MDLLFEFLFEIIIDGSAEICANKKISKWIRYPLGILLLLFFIFVIGTVGVVGISMTFDKSILIKIAGIFFVLLDALFIYSFIKKLKKYL